MDCSDEDASRSSDRGPARTRQALALVRRPQGPVRARHQRRPGRGRQHHRTQRRRQVHGLQRRHRRVRTERRRRSLRRQEHRRPGAVQDHPPGHRAHVPEPAAVLEHVRQGERDGGDLRRHQGHAARVDLPPASRAPRGTRGSKAHRERAGILRPAAGGLPLGPAGLQPVLRKPPAPRDRPCAGNQAAAAAARRARRRHEPQRDARGHRADRPPANRARRRDPRDRARHARRRRLL